MQPFDIFPRRAMDRRRPKATAIIRPQNTRGGLAQPRRSFQHRVPHRYEVAGRGVDDLQDLGGGGLLCQRFIALSGNLRYSRQHVVALDGALYQLRFKLGDGSWRFNLRRFALRSHLCACELSFPLHTRNRAQRVDEPSESGIRSRDGAERLLSIEPAGCAWLPDLNGWKRRRPDCQITRLSDQTRRW